MAFMFYIFIGIQQHFFTLEYRNSVIKRLWCNSKQTVHQKSNINRTRFYYCLNGFCTEISFRHFQSQYKPEYGNCDSSTDVTNHMIGRSGM